MGRSWIMGKRIRSQRRGRGSPTFRASTHKRVAPIEYPPTSKEEGNGSLQGRVEEVLHEPGRGSPLASVRLETGETYHTVAPEGAYEGQPIQVGSGAPVDIGNVLPLGEIPEGTMVCNVELSPGDGGKIARSSGAHATVVAHTPQGTLVRLPSDKKRYLHDLCRATVGVVSGGGRVEKPFLKAGSKFHKMRAKGHMYPRTRGAAMVAAAHPHGSSKRGAHKVKVVGHGAPPGKKVGLIAAKRAGKRKRKKV